MALGGVVGVVALLALALALSAVASRTPALLFTLVGLLLLVGGSLYVPLVLLGIGSDPRDYSEAAGLVFALVWPLALFSAGLCGAAALLTERRVADAVVLLLGVAGVESLVRHALRRGAFRIIRRQVRLVDGAQGLPVRDGLSIVLIVLPFLLVDAGSAYFAWRYML